MTRKSRQLIEKHQGVTFEEAQTVFHDQAALTVSDYESDPSEERLVTIGMSASGKILVVVYTIRRERVSLIFARKANRHEQQEDSQQ